MLQIKGLSDGKTWEANYDSMLPLWNEHHARDINQQTPDELALFYMNGKWEIVGWNEAEGMNESGYQPIELDPSLYSVTDPNSIPREEVKRVLEQRAKMLTDAATIFEVLASDESYAPNSNTFAPTVRVRDIARSFLKEHADEIAALSQKGAEG